MAQSEYTIEETDLNVLVCLRLSELQNEQLGIDVTVRLTTADVTASADPVPLPANDAFCNLEDTDGDYETAQTLEVQFSSASTVGTIACTPITINNDIVVEDPETFTVSIIDSLPPGIELDPSATSATVFIISDASDSKHNVTQQFY